MQPLKTLHVCCINTRQVKRLTIDLWFFLFVGPSRCGKSEAAEQISKVLFQQQPNHQLKFNMGQFQLDHEVSKLNGAPSGNRSSSDGELAVLATYDRAVVILDEIEKAHPNVLLFFLSLFDRVCYRTGSGKLIVCRSAIFVMTSNVVSWCSKLNTLEPFSGSTTELCPSRAEAKVLGQGWRPEFWARISHCIPFLPLSIEQQVVGAKHFLKVYLLGRLLLCMPIPSDPPEAI